MLSDVNTVSFHVQVPQHVFQLRQPRVSLRALPDRHLQTAHEPEIYQEFLDNYPEKHWFKYMAKFGHKYSLSDYFDAKKFYRHLRGNPLWNAFNKWIKSRDFVSGARLR